MTEPARPEDPLCPPIGTVGLGLFLAGVGLGIVEIGALFDGHGLSYLGSPSARPVLISHLVLICFGLLFLAVETALSRLGRILDAIETRERDQS